MRLTFDELRAKNKTRMQRWHGAGPEWTAADWAVAFAGEAGEACNAVKKLKRVLGGFANKSEDPARQLDTKDKALAAIGEELADTIIYADLLADHLGIDLSAAIAAKFNKTSDTYSFPEKLGVITAGGAGRLTASQLAGLHSWLQEEALAVASAAQMFAAPPELVAVSEKLAASREYVQIGLRLVREHDLFRMFYERIKQLGDTDPAASLVRPVTIAQEIEILEGHLGV